MLEGRGRHARSRRVSKGTARLIRARVRINPPPPTESNSIPVGGSAMCSKRIRLPLVFYCVGHKKRLSIQLRRLVGLTTFAWAVRKMKANWITLKKTGARSEGHGLHCRRAINNFCIYHVKVTLRAINLLGGGKNGNLG